MFGGVLVEDGVTRNPFRSDLLEAIFKICEDPNFVEEEYLAGVTGMNVHHINSLCKQYLSPLCFSLEFLKLTNQVLSKRHLKYRPVQMRPKPMGPNRGFDAVLKRLK